MLSRLGPLQGLNNLKIPPPFYLCYCKSCTHSRQSPPVTTSQGSVQQVRSKVRGLLSFIPEAKQDYSFNFPNTLQNSPSELSERLFPRLKSSVMHLIKDNSQLLDSTFFCFLFFLVDRVAKSTELENGFFPPWLVCVHVVTSADGY